jgi:hypothetical protein
MLTSSFLARASARKEPKGSKGPMHPTGHYATKGTKGNSAFGSTTTTKKVMHMDNALSTDILMLCNRKEATNRAQLRFAKSANIRNQLKI